MIDADHPKWPKTHPGDGRRDPCIAEPDISGRTDRRGQQGLERSLPPRTQRVDLQGPRKCLPRMPRQVQQAVDVGDSHRPVAGSDLDHRIAGLHNAFAQHPKVEPGTMMGDQQRGQARFAHPHTHPITGDPRLADLEQCATDLESVADADLVIGKSFDREVLAELARSEIVPAEFVTPVLVRVELVDHHRAVRPTVAAEITLSVAVDIEFADHLRSVNGVLPHSGVHGLAMPRHITGEPDIDRDEAAGRLRRSMILRRDWLSTSIRHLGYPHPAIPTKG